MSTALSSKVIQQIANYLLLNSIAIDSSGLYKGKAGHALCLFEIANFISDNQIEDAAFDILQEALLSKTNNKAI